jgi:hypothetical protein
MEKFNYTFKKAVILITFIGLPLLDYLYWITFIGLPLLDYLYWITFIGLPLLFFVLKFTSLIISSYASHP